MEIEDDCVLFPFSFKKKPHVKYYRIFSIKRRGRLFKTRPCITRRLFEPAFIRGPAFIY